MSATVRASLKSIALCSYRLAMVVLIVWLIREHYLWLRVDAGAPINVEEVAAFLPQTHDLELDAAGWLGVHALDTEGRRIGYAVRTMPMCKILGYSGFTDTLVVLDTSLKVVGAKIRSTEDNKTHVEDIIYDRQFLRTWNGLTWDEVAAMDIEQANIEGVSGATETSLAIAESITQRLRLGSAQIVPPLPMRVNWNDAGIGVVALAAMLMAFSHLHGRRWLRRAFQAVVVAYVGFITGDLISQSLLAGWARSGVPWRTASGMVLLVAAALVVPWATRKPLYCQHLCPYGAVQEWFGRLLPQRMRLHLPHSLAAGLRWLPPMLLALVIIVIMVVLPFDLTKIEPFDSFVISAAGQGTIIVALIGLVASLFVPMAYCHYGCPTGALLEFVRPHGPSDRFGRRDVAAALLVLLAALLHWKYAAIYSWIVGP
ncbi:MAG: 4Fe-4S binding protein [Verrucomicrobia bacterium]|nr:4Fe-4S binding protein [Verrucomicrobiota bacterium]